MLPYTTSVGADTLDECLMASKPMERILANIEPTVDILKIIRPVYNFNPLCRRIPIPTDGSKAESGQNIRTPPRGETIRKNVARGHLKRTENASRRNGRKHAHRMIRRDQGDAA